MTDSPNTNRRNFIKTTGVGVAAGLAATQYSALANEGSNSNINLGLIGCGGRGMHLLRTFRGKEGVKFVAVCDVYVRRRKEAAAAAGLDPENEKDVIADYKELLERADVDAVIIATPDHWHAPQAIDAMNAGKDVYLEKPMTRTVEEAKEVHEVTQKTGRILQVGSQTTSSDQWWKVKKAISDGMIGKLIMSQGSYHRNSTGGEWNWSIDEGAGPRAEGDDFVDWDMWLGSAPKRDWDPDRFFRYRKFWDYSGGIATDLFYHVVAPFNICWPSPQFPYKVSGSGGIYVFKDSREVPDTFALIAEFPGEHQLALTSSMANSQHIPGLIRGHEGTVMIVPHGAFEGRVDYVTVNAERPYREQFVEKFGSEEIRMDVEPREDHYDNFLRCVRERAKPVLDSEIGYKAMVTIAMSVESYRQGRVLYFDEENERIVTSAPRRS